MREKQLYGAIICKIEKSDIDLCMENLENDNKSINNLSKDAVDGKELKGGGAPGSVDPMDGIDAGWIDPNDPFGGVRPPGEAVAPSDPANQHPNGVVDPLNPGGPLDNGPIGEILPPTVV